MFTNGHYHWFVCECMVFTILIVGFVVMCCQKQHNLGVKDQQKAKLQYKNARQKKNQKTKPLSRYQTTKNQIII